MITRGTAGTLIARLGYKPYGLTAWNTTSLMQQTDLLFTDQRSESAMLGALYDYGARHYDSAIGRFLSADTVVPGAGNPQAVNRYSYALGSPLTYKDPNGHMPCNTGGFDPIGETKGPCGQTGGGGGGEGGGGGRGGRGAGQTSEPLEVSPSEGTSVRGAPEGTPPNPASANATSAEPWQFQRGNRAHYDEVNGGKGQALPTQIQREFPETEFDFPRRGQRGADVNIPKGTRHPSEYPESTWPEGFDHGDFKPNTPSGARSFCSQLNSGKLPPDTVPIPYYPVTGEWIGFFEFQ